MITRNILQRIVSMSKRDYVFETELIKLLESFENGQFVEKKEKKPSFIITLIAVIIAIILFLSIALLIIHTFLDIKIVESIFNKLPI